jgi:hypothetical protein
MQAKIIARRRNTPMFVGDVASVTYDAVSDNEILFVFTLRKGEEMHISEVIELDPRSVLVGRSSLAPGQRPPFISDCLKVLNVTSRRHFDIELHSDDIHDLRLVGGHGKWRTPSLERLNAH